MTASDTAHRAANSDVLENLARIGLIAYGDMDLPPIPPSSASPEAESEADTGIGD